MVKPIVIAAAYLIVGSVVIPIMFSIFRAQYKLLDVVLASASAGVLSLIPMIGSEASLLGAVLILNYRTGASLFPDIVLSVAIARLAMVPALMPFAVSGPP
jgi:hypothetical protein